MMVSGSVPITPPPGPCPGPPVYVDRGGLRQEWLTRRNRLLSGLSPELGFGSLPGRRKSGPGTSVRLVTRRSVWSKTNFHGLLEVGLSESKTFETELSEVRIQSDLFSIHYSPSSFPFYHWPFLKNVQVSHQETSPPQERPTPRRRDVSSGRRKDGWGWVLRNLFGPSPRKYYRRNQGATLSGFVTGYRGNRRFCVGPRSEPRDHRLDPTSLFEGG